ncbi:hypothetical protein ACFSJ3_11330 [Corallincola platygyrae]|uniref:Uncharacterized protein n=1 Tax=Corallincola platygyrae TaxID=1193278 RepID=A0ABW4XLX2_9GAMM
MKFKFALVFAALVSGGLTACGGPEAPSCDDSDTKDLVLEIVVDELVSQIGKTAAETVDLELDAIRTTDFNEKTGMQECAAELIAEGPGGETTADITYTSELTDEDDEFYVTVYGL